MTRTVILTERIIISSWNSQDTEETPVVRDLLPECKNQELRAVLYDLFGVDTMLDKHIILLSSGELRKFQLTKTLLSNPRVLIMDNPFIGLDAKTRDLLHELLQKLTEVTPLQVIPGSIENGRYPSFYNTCHSCCQPLLRKENNPRGVFVDKCRCSCPCAD